MATAAAAASEDAAPAAAPNPYAVFVKAAPPSGASRQNGPAVAAAPVADAAAAPNPYMKFAAAGAAASAGSGTQGVPKKVASASRLSDTAPAAGGATAANPYARFQQAAAAKTAVPAAPVVAAPAAAANPYERFMQAGAGKSPGTANGVASAPAKAKVTATESAGAAASLEAVALLATQMPADVEVRLVSQRVHATHYHLADYAAPRLSQNVAAADSDTRCLDERAPGLFDRSVQRLPVQSRSKTWGAA